MVDVGLLFEGSVPAVNLAGDDAPVITAGVGAGLFSKFITQRLITEQDAEPVGERVWVAGGDVEAGFPITDEVGQTTDL